MQKQYLFFLLLPLLWGCANDDNNTLEWTIPAAEVFDGGPGKDGIPSIDSPVFANVDEINFLADDDLLVVMKIGTEIRAYPHPILDWHEIVNDEIGNTAFALTYCPLTGTGTAWPRENSAAASTFGVSGLLYNTNIIPYDRATDSNWSQMLLECVAGQRSGEKIETITVIETTWATLKDRWPAAKVQTTDTGFSRDYDSYPYGDYRTNDNNLIFPIAVDDDRRPRKERGLSVLIDGTAKYYGFELFEGTGQVQTDLFAGRELVLFGSKTNNYSVAYESRLTNGNIVSFPTGEFTDNPVDGDGNHYNLFGEIIAGPQQGQRLQSVDNFIGYFFAWGTFYPDLPIAE